MPGHGGAFEGMPSHQRRDGVAGTIKWRQHIGHQQEYDDDQEQDPEGAQINRFWLEAMGYGIGLTPREYAISLTSPAFFQALSSFKRF